MGHLCAASNQLFFTYVLRLPPTRDSREGGDQGLEVDNLVKVTLAWTSELTVTLTITGVSTGDQ